MTYPLLEFGGHGPVLLVAPANGFPPGTYTPILQPLTAHFRVVCLPEYFLDACDFIAGFADGCHHRKEEGVLFVELAASGMPANQGPIGVMLHEHEQGRAFTRAIREAARKLAEGDAGATRALIANAKGYVALLRDHIAKEDEVLFPMADQLIPPERHDQLLAGFARVEHLDTGPGAHQKFLDLADRLTAPWLSVSAPAWPTPPPLES